MNINWTKGDIQCTTVESFADHEPYVELVKWNTDEDGRRYCFTLAYFKKNRDGDVTLHFVGDRPFQEIAEIDINDVWKEMWLSAEFLRGNSDEYR